MRLWLTVDSYTVNSLYRWQDRNDLDVYFGNSTFSNVEFKKKLCVIECTNVFEISLFLDVIITM